MLKAVKFSFLSIILVFATLLVITPNSTAKAAENEVEEWNAENIGVSTELPVFVDGKFEIMPLGLGPPSNYINLASGEVLSFKGTATGSTLYTNSGFYGKQYPNINVRNAHSTETLTIKIYKSSGLGWFSVASATCKPGYSLNWSPKLESGVKYYLSFSAPSNFYGTVK